MYNEKMITIQAKEAKNLKDKIIGLIGKKPYPLLIKTHFGIHTFGLKFAIDIIIVDKHNRVIAIKNDLKPKRIYFWNPRYEKVLELPNGTIKKKGIKINDSIKIISSNAY
jgi:uncharacterized protein